MCLLGSICLIYAARTNIILLFAARAESEELYGERFVLNTFDVLSTLTHRETPYCSVYKLEK